MDGTFAIFTMLIIGVTLCTSAAAFARQGLMEGLVFSPIRVLRDRQYHRVITSGFLHANWPHLIFNMFSLYAFGWDLERAFGPQILLAVYFASILGGSLVSLCLHRHDEDYHALGASGGVCGVIFASIFLLPGGGIVAWPLPFPIPSWLYAIAFILVSFFGIRSRTDNVGHDAHMGGAIVGLVVATAFDPSIIGQSPWLYAAVVLITTALVVDTYIWPAHVQRDLADWRRLWADRRTESAARKHADDDVFLDRMLAKIARSGMVSVSARERRRLRAISKRKSRQDQQAPEQTRAKTRSHWLENVKSKD